MLTFSLNDLFLKCIYLTEFTILTWETLFLNITLDSENSQFYS